MQHLLTASLLVRVVATVVAMIALQGGIDALVPAGAAELIQATGHAAAALLVASGAAVQVAIAAFLLGHARSGQAAASAAASLATGRGPGGGVAEDIRVLALAISCNQDVGGA